MRAISLHQPWASFIAIGVKPYETRDWPPPQWLIGRRIAIHAAKKAVDADNREWARRHGCDDLPLGAVVCTARLHGAYQIGSRDLLIQSVPGSARMCGTDEDEFGDYSPGRWMWWLTDIERFYPPIPARGMQGFWNWEPVP